MPFIGPPTANAPQIPVSVVHYGAQPFRRLFVPGAFYAASAQATNITTAYNANTLYVIPFIVPYNGIVSAFSLANVTAIATNQARVAIYDNVASNKTLYPNALLFDSGILNTAPGGGLTFAGYNLSLQGGKLYWAGLHFKLGSTLTMIGNITQAPAALLAFGTDPTNLALPRVNPGLNVAAAFAGGLPDPFPLTALPEGPTGYPLIGMTID